MLFTVCTQTSAQTICGFDSLLARQSLDPNFRSEVEKVNASIQQFILRRAGARMAETTIDTIPVVVHVVHTGGEVGTAFNPTDQRIINTIDYLNSIYSGTAPGLKGAGDLQIRFKLASLAPDGSCTSGITRTNAAIYPGYEQYGVNVQQQDGLPQDVLRGIAAWDVSRYFNVYVVNKIDGDFSGIGGFSSLPTTTINPNDGIVLLASEMMPGVGTLPHEFGHSLGLYHTFEAYPNWPTDCPPAGPCETTGDRVCDTDPNVVSFSCRLGFTNGCTGLPFHENTEENFMSYTSCKTLFTPGQKQRMLAALSLPSRQTLIASAKNVLIPCNTNERCSSATLLESSLACNYLEQEFFKVTPAADVCNGGGAAGSGILWYAFMAKSETQTLTVDPAGSRLQATAAIYLSCDDATPLYCKVAANAGAVLVFPLSGLTPGFTYYLAIGSHDALTEPTTFRLCLTNPCIAPGRPTKLEVTVTGPSTAKVSWQSPVPEGSPTISYRVEIATSVAFTNREVIAETQGLAYGARELRCNTTYFARVKALTSCNGTSSEYITSVPFTTTDCSECVTPGPPVNVAATLTGETSARLSWGQHEPAGSPIVSYRWVVGTSDTVRYENGIIAGTTQSHEVDLQPGSLPCGTTLYLRVAASTECNRTISEYVTSASFTTPACVCQPPAAPKNIVHTPGNFEIDKISWSPVAVAGGDTIRYYYVVDSTGDSRWGEGLVQGITTDTVVNMQSLKCNTKFYFRVFAKTSCNGSSSSYSQLSYTSSPCVQCTVPSAPLNPVGVATRATDAKLSWAPGTTVGSGLVSYWWVVGITPDVTYDKGVARGITFGTSASVKSLTCDTEYFLRVYARTDCSNKISEYSTSPSFRTTACTGCTTPGAPPFVSIATGGVSANFYWQAGSPAGSPTVTYYWVLGTSDTVTYSHGLVQGITTNTSLINVAVQCGKRYYFRIFAATTCDGTRSDYVTQEFMSGPCQVPCTAPSMPTGLTVSDITNSSVSLSWAPVAGGGTGSITYYWVVGTSTGTLYGSGLQQGRTTDTAVLIANLSCEKAYYFRVYAETSCNLLKSGYATSNIFSTSSCCQPPNAPEKPFSAVTGSTTAYLSWSLPQGSTSSETYYWVVGTTSTVTWGEGLAQGSTTGNLVYVDTLPCNTKLFLRVFSKKSCGATSAYSTSAPFTTAICESISCASANTPVNARAAGTGTATATLSWSPGSPAGTGTVTYYWVVGKEANLTWGNGLFQGSTSDTTVLVDSLTCSTRYHMRVFARTECNGTASSYASAEFETLSCTINCITPGAPANVRIQQMGRRWADLAWDKGDPVGSGNISYVWSVGRTPEDAQVQRIISGSTTGLLDRLQPLECGQTYYAAVAAFSLCNSRFSPSSILEFTMPDCCTLTNAGTPTLTAEERGLAVLSWAPATTNTGEVVTYECVLASATSETYGEVLRTFSTTDTSATVSVNCHTPYYFTVTARSSCDLLKSETKTSAPFSIGECPCKTPSTPQNLQAEALNATSVRFSWSPVAPEKDSVNYMWYYGFDPGTRSIEWIGAGYTLDTTVVLSNLNCNTTYYGRVVAFTTCDSSYSNFGETLSFQTDINSCVTAVPSIPEVSDFLLLPNPNGGVFEVRYHLARRVPVKYTVFDATGQQVYELEDHPPAGTVKKVIRLDSRASGTYYLRLQTGSRFFVHKVIITR